MATQTIILIIIALLALLLIVFFNRLVRKRNYCRNAFSQIDVQLTRRHDLVPNLVAVAKKYLQHEQETLQAVISARNSADGRLQASREDIGQIALLRALSGAEHAFTGALGHFMATVEAYPELKADTQMATLSEELIHTENRIAFARQAYNDGVMFYNNDRESFPSNVIAGLFSFKPMGKLELEFSVERPELFK